jgi:TonB family protein
LLGALVLVGGAIGLYVWKKPPPPATTPQATTATATAKPEVPAPLYAPPPPPKLDDEDAGAATDAGTVAAKPAAVGGSAPGPGPCGGTCTGTATGGLSSALRSRAGSAQGCYNRALRSSEVSGSLTVSVQVGPSGQVCAASIVNDSVHSGEISSCVLSRFRGQSFPPPSGGCVTVNIPISFTIKN